MARSAPFASPPTSRAWLGSGAVHAAVVAGLLVAVGSQGDAPRRRIVHATVSAPMSPVAFESTSSIEETMQVEQPGPPPVDLSDIEPPPVDPTAFEPIAEPQHLEFDDPRVPTENVSLAQPTPVVSKSEPQVAEPSAPQVAEASAPRVAALSQPYVGARAIKGVGRDPVYPSRARDAGWAGTVWLLLTIDASGSVTAADVDQSSGFRILDRAAVRAAKTWRFTPALDDGHPVASTKRIPVEFRIEAD